MQYVATIGFFDGVHKGHQFLLEHLQEVARREGLSTMVVTFDEHPETILRGWAKPLLSSTQERLTLLSQNGADEVLVLPFEHIRSLTAEQFMVYLKGKGVALLLMGYDHRFGVDRLVTFEDYRRAAERADLRLQLITEAPDGHISSSTIRKALAAGDITRANDMLGRPYSLTGKVVHGNGIGRTIGFPTANIQVPEYKLLPAEGVYVGMVDRHKSIVNVGFNPTVDGRKETVEVHIPDFSGDLYGQTLTVSLLKRLRGEQKFDSLDELQAQIRRDITSL